MESRIDDPQAHMHSSGTHEPYDAYAVIRALAQPRMTGSAGADAVESELRSRFEALGYAIRDLPFNFSMTAGRFALTKIAAVYTVGVLGATLLVANQLPAGAIVVLAGSLALMLLYISYMRKNGIAQLPWGRSEGNNLWVQREGAHPRYILMAHRDSKSQILPLSLRGPAILLGILAWIALLMLAILSLARFVGMVPVVLVGIVAFVCGFALAVSWADDRSPGALDNASGLAALLGVAAREKNAADVAFLITDAEELGLAGARAIAPRMPPVFGVINVDSIDDVGTFLIAERFGWPRPSGLAPNLAAALLGSAAELGLPAHRRDVPFGILLDHMPIVKGGTPALTLMRGTLGSLHRIHRPSDDLSHLRGTGVVQCVDLLCGALALLRKA
ncbi:MAG: M28 family peptidase [Longimicrobiales bacterium]